MIWAFGKFFKEGGYISFRRAKVNMWGMRGWWVHFFWSEDGKEWYSYTAVDKATNIINPFEILWFTGYIKEGID